MFIPGDALRQQREAAGVTLAALAAHLGLRSTSYLSDVERGQRGPFAADRIRSAAALFGVDAAPLFLAAGQTRARFVLGGPTAAHVEVGALLAGRWDGLDEVMLRGIARAIEE